LALQPHLQAISMQAKGVNVPREANQSGLIPPNLVPFLVPNCDEEALLLKASRPGSGFRGGFDIWWTGGESNP
jgi:hypothetical protein